MPANSVMVGTIMSQVQTVDITKYVVYCNYCIISVLLGINSNNIRGALIIGLAITNT